MGTCALRCEVLSGGWGGLRLLPPQVRRPLPPLGRRVGSCRPQFASLDGGWGGCCFPQSAAPVGGGNRGGCCRQSWTREYGCSTTRPFMRVHQSAAGVFGESFVPEWGISPAGES